MTLIDHEYERISATIASSGGPKWVRSDVFAVCGRCRLCPSLATAKADIVHVNFVPKAEIGMIVLKRSGAKRQATALSAVISCLPDGKLNSTVHAFFCERECDRAAEFVRDEIAYEVGAVARWMLTGHRGAAKLAPVQG